MIVVAGPPGSGKSVRLNVGDFGVDSFNVDDRCRELHGSYSGIPVEVRRRAQAECEAFIEVHLRARRSFAVETTLGGGAAIEQARRAASTGFETRLLYLGTRDLAINLERIRRRGLAGGHSAPEETIRSIARRSLANLSMALTVFESAVVFDNSDAAPRPVIETSAGKLLREHPPVPDWVRQALRTFPGLSGP
jgi:predicted ABC-type ATPase